MAVAIWSEYLSPRDRGATLARETPRKEKPPYVGMIRGTQGKIVVEKEREEPRFYSTSGASFFAFSLFLSLSFSGKMGDFVRARVDIEWRKATWYTQRRRIASFSKLACVCRPISFGIFQSSLYFQDLPSKLLVMVGTPGLINETKKIIIIIIINK